MGEPPSFVGAVQVLGLHGVSDQPTPPNVYLWIFWLTGKVFVFFSTVYPACSIKISCPNPNYLRSQQFSIYLPDGSRLGHPGSPILPEDPPERARLVGASGAVWLDQLDEIRMKCQETWMKSAIHVSWGFRWI